MIQAHCKGCDRTIDAPADRAGMTLLCPVCGSPVTFPGGAPEDPLAALAGAVAAPASHAPRHHRQHTPVTPQSNGLAVVALVMGICSLLIPITFVYLVRITIIAELFCAGIGGAVSVAALQRSRQTHSGRGMAIAGMVLCLVPMLPIAILVALELMGNISLLGLL